MLSSSGKEVTFLQLVTAALMKVMTWTPRVMKKKRKNTVTHESPTSSSTNASSSTPSKNNSRTQLAGLASVREFMTFEQRQEAIRLWTEAGTVRRRGQTLKDIQRYEYVCKNFTAKFSRPPPAYNYIKKISKKTFVKPDKERRGQKTKYDIQEVEQLVKPILEETRGIITLADLARRIDMHPRTLSRYLESCPELGDQIIFPTVKKDYDHYKKLIQGEKARNPNVTRQEVAKNIGIGIVTLYRFLRKDQELADLFDFKPTKDWDNVNYR